VCGAWSSYVILDLKFEVSKYQKGIQWLKELLWNTQFTKERLKVGVGKLIAGLLSLIPQLNQ
jgi:Zn-dependent M16 (insulinase) family peptidase